MKWIRIGLILLILVLLCSGGMWLTLRVTAEYPEFGEAVSYPVNQMDGFTLTIEEPSWSPFRGYTIRWRVTADSEAVFTFSKGGEEDPGFEHLERCVDGQWYRLGRSQDTFSFNCVDFALGAGKATGLEGSVVQAYAYYGTRLEPGSYRLVLEMRAEDGTSHYLAAEFEVS